MRRLASLLCLLLLPAAAAFGAAPCHPIDTDPANFTEGPYTLDAGRSQVEWDALTWSRTRADGFRTDDLAVSAVVLRTALTASTELQVFHDGWLSHHTRDEATGEIQHDTGWGDTTVQFKRNLAGNDGGRIAFGAAVSGTFATGARAVGGNESTLGASLLLAATLWSNDTASFSSHSQLRGVHGPRSRFVELRHSFIYCRQLGEKDSLAGEINFARTTESGARWTTCGSLTWSHCFRPDLSLDVAATGSFRGGKGLGSFIDLTRWF